MTTANTRFSIALTLTFGRGNNGANNLIDVTPDTDEAWNTPTIPSMPALVRTDELDQELIATKPFMRARPASNVLTDTEAGDLASWVEANEPKPLMQVHGPQLTVTTEIPTRQLIELCEQDEEEGDEEIEEYDPALECDIIVLNANEQGNRAKAAMALVAILLVLAAGALTFVDTVEKVENNAAGDYAAMFDGE